ncbi:GNAT family N-acetyltransferase [Bacillus suaedaesalsae]|uniref:GNAT family N-acetyltransferase n=1 Tax=Bacillus suaedaesalsae TaxID=2810349 RepID=A0ABS2DEA5_9BACI|nr:GNAT family N-acetyltransferase [Bacillus suaedaesalsae]MBM6616756.1 GNAT family N-acetyltransferase [Bacillus suaedaesalsae]
MTKHNVVIKEMKTKKDFESAYPVMHELRTHLSLEDYFSLLDKMVPQGFRMFAAFHAEQVVAVTGVIELVNFYNFKHLYVYDLVTKETERSKGYGDVLLSYIHTLAEESDCRYVALSSGLQRTDAHRFYEEKMNYKKTSYSFVYEVEK